MAEEETISCYIEGVSFKPNGDGDLEVKFNSRWVISKAEIDDGSINYAMLGWLDTLPLRGLTNVTLAPLQGGLPFQLIKRLEREARKRQNQSTLLDEPDDGLTDEERSIAKASAEAYAEELARAPVSDEEPEPAIT